MQESRLSVQPAIQGQTDLSNDPSVVNIAHVSDSVYSISHKIIIARQNIVLSFFKVIIRIL